MNIWFAIPSARPAAEAEPRLAKWREQGYKLAIWRDNPEPITCDLELRGKYPGYYGSINRLVKEIIQRDPDAHWIVSGGDDMEPDPNKSALQIAAECCEHFTGTCGVMQPTGDRWGHNGHIYAENVAGSPWLGRGWCLRAYEGKGPVCEEYWHMWGDQELQEVAILLGRFWQRQDLSHFHAHYQRKGQGPEHEFHRKTSHAYKTDGVIFRRRKADGFPGHALA